MLSTVIESQLSVIWDTTKTNRYPREMPQEVHIWYNQEREEFCLFCQIWSKSCLLLFYARGGKFLYFYADVICEWSFINKNELQFTLDDSNLEGDKGDHYGMAHENNNILYKLVREFL